MVVLARVELVRAGDSAVARTVTHGALLLSATLEHIVVPGIDTCQESSEHEPTHPGKRRARLSTNTVYVCNKSGM